MNRYFWSDNETVLGYIVNEAKRFNSFVCNQVKRIRDSTTSLQWHSVSTKKNPANIESRGASVSQLTDTWLYGTEFLSNPTFKMQVLHAL